MTGEAGGRPPGRRPGAAEQFGPGRAALLVYDARMLQAQALVERGLVDAVVAAVWSAVMQVDYYVGQGNTKWVLAGLAVVLAVLFFKPRR